MEYRSIDNLIEELEKDIKRWEGQEIEFMQDFPKSAHELAKEMAAFATSNNGRIYLGVDKNKKIIGISSIKNTNDTEGKDNIINKLAGIAKSSIKPPIIVTSSFIDIKDKDKDIVILKINVPKGIEPIYFSSNVPYIRILTISDVATPSQIKELHRKYFLGQDLFEESNKDHDFLNNLICQLSDFQILWSDHKNRDINPDFDQMMYHINSIYAILSKLLTESSADKFGLSKDINSLIYLLDDLLHHKIYLADESYRNFCDKGDKILELTDLLLQKILKTYHIQSDQSKIIKEKITKNIRELRNSWEKKDRYEENMELASLKVIFMTLAYNFNRFGNLLSGYDNINSKLKQAAIDLREISSVKYFMPYLNTLKLINGTMEKILKNLDDIYNNIQ